MYGVTKQSNPSWIQSVNLCNIDVLKAYFIYMKKIQRMGIRGIRIDQADAVSHQFISLFLNSDVSKTPSLLQAVLNLCNDAKSPQVNKDVNYPLEQNIQNANMEDFTNYDFDIQSMENFTYELRASAEKEKGWRGQLDMLDNVNDPLNKNDWAGCIDYPLKYILNDMFNTADNSIDGSYFVKDKMIIGYEKYKNITLTIVDNHDTIYLNTLYQGISPITKGAPGQEINFYRIIAAYFVIMMLPGIPTVNKVHYDIYKTIGLQTLMQLRNDCCIDSNSNFEITTAESNNISWKVSNLNFSIVGRLPPIIPKPTIATVAVLLEINEKQPVSSNVWNQLIFGTKLYMKISYL
jgi:hypothetical protein